MEERTRPCRACGRPIYRHARLCPYCQVETKFVSVDEFRAQHPVAAPVEEPTPADEVVVAAVAEPAAPPTVAKSVAPAVVAPVDAPAVEAEAGLTEEPESDSKPSLRKRLTEILAEDSAKVREEYEQKIGRKYSRSTILIGSVIALLSIIVLGIFLAFQWQSHRVYSVDSTIDGWVKQVLDSMEQEVSQQATVIAKFPDKDRHYMFYLKDKHLYLFDAKDHTDQEFDFQARNPRAVVDYNSSGVLNAYLSPSEDYVLVLASRAAGNSECGLYRIDTKRKIVEYLDRGRISTDKEGYKVSSYGRTASYDANGEKVTGMSGDEAERLMQQRAATKTNRSAASDEPSKEPSAPAPSVTQQISPKIDVTEKPKVPEKVKITPVE